MEEVIDSSHHNVWEGQTLHFPFWVTRVISLKVWKVPNKSYFCVSVMVRNQCCTKSLVTVSMSPSQDCVLISGGSFYSSKALSVCLSKCNMSQPSISHGENTSNIPVTCLLPRSQHAPYMAQCITNLISDLCYNNFSYTHCILEHRLLCVAGLRYYLKKKD